MNTSACVCLCVSDCDLCENGKRQRHEYGYDPRDTDNYQPDTDRHARSQRM